MTTSRIARKLAALLVLSCMLGPSSAKSPEQEDWDAARKASCPELVDAYMVTSKAEREVVAAIKASTNGTIATNVLGVASLAVLGVGFFTWDDNASNEENLADLRHDLDIITTVASEKKCVLPAPDTGKK
jgi:hypothetical protein